MGCGRFQSGAFETSGGLIVRKVEDMKGKVAATFFALSTAAAFAVPPVEPAVLEKFQSYFKTMGDPSFRLISSGEAMDVKFAEFFTGIGMKISRTPQADYVLEAVGNFQRVVDPEDDERRGLKLSMAVKITSADGGRVLLTLKNDPRFATSFASLGEERLREVVVDKAFAQIQGPLLTEIKTMADRLGIDGGAPSVGVGVLPSSALAVNPGDVEIVIMEEPFSLGQMKVADSLGTGLDGARYFYQNYTAIQRKVRDKITELAAGAKFDVKLLEGNEAYSRFKTKDSTLVGFYYDVETEKFAKDDDLFAAVRDNNPEALVLYYRVDSLVYDKSAGRIHVSMALNLKVPGENTTRPVGMSTQEFSARGGTPDIIMDEVANAATETIRRLWIAGNAGGKLVGLVSSIKTSAAAAASAPLKLNINASVFDVKVRKKVLYALKKKLVEKKLCSPADVKSTNNSLRATIAKGDIADAEALYMEHVGPILEEMGLEISDDQVNYAGRELLIKPGQEESK